MRWWRAMTTPCRSDGRFRMQWMVPTSGGTMRRFFRCRGAGLAAAVCLLNVAFAQNKAYTWQELRDRFEAANPTLRAGELNVSESKAQEITAFLRPNPDFTAI